MFPRHLRLWAATTLLIIGTLVWSVPAGATTFESDHDIGVGAGTADDTDPPAQQPVSPTPTVNSTPTLNSEAAISYHGISPRQLHPEWLQVIGRSAIWGGMIGGVVAVGVQLVSNTEVSPWLMPRFVGKGVVIGAVTGVVEALMWSNGFVGSPPDSVSWLRRGVPSTFDVRLLEVQF